MTLDAVHERLATALRGPLPGHAAFLSRSGYSRADLDSAQRADTAPRESAVLALLYPAMGEPHLLLMRRPEYAGVHSGQVSFPGGRREPRDTDLQATALREFHEEIGATPKDLRVLGALSQVYIPPSRSLVTPFVGLAWELGPTRPDPREVQALLEVPLAELLRPDVIRQRRQHIQVLGREAEIPYFDLGGQVVWGATAMMLAELRELLHG